MKEYKCSECPKDPLYDGVNAASLPHDDHKSDSRTISDVDSVTPILLTSLTTAQLQTQPLYSRNGHTDLPSPRYPLAGQVNDNGIIRSEFTLNTEVHNPKDICEVSENSEHDVTMHVPFRTSLGQR